MSKKIQDMSKKFSLCANRYVERGFAHKMKFSWGGGVLKLKIKRRTIARCRITR